MSNAQDEIFDATLLQLGHDALVGKGRQFTTSSSGIKKLGKSVTKPLEKFSTAGIVRYIVSLPLNALPVSCRLPIYHYFDFIVEQIIAKVVGTGLFLLYNGTKTGPGFHSRYFQFKQMNASQREEFIEKHRGGYTSYVACSRCNLGFLK